MFSISTILAADAIFFSKIPFIHSLILNKQARKWANDGIVVAILHPQLTIIDICITTTNNKPKVNQLDNCWHIYVRQLSVYLRLTTFALIKKWTSNI